MRWRCALLVTVLVIAATSASAQATGACKPGVTRTAEPLTLARSFVIAGNSKDVVTLRSLLTPDAAAFSASDKETLTADALIAEADQDGDTENYTIKSTIVSGDNVTLQLKSADGEEALMTLSTDRGCIAAIAYFD